MLAVGGITALQYATVIFGLPFAFVVGLVMLGLLKALRIEARRVDSGAHVDVESATGYLDTVVAPALREVADELSVGGVAAEVSGGQGEDEDGGLAINDCLDQYGSNRDDRQASRGRESCPKRIQR